MTMKRFSGCALAGLLLALGRGVSAEQAAGQPDEGGADLKAVLERAKDPGVNQRLTDLLGGSSSVEPKEEEPDPVTLAYAGPDQETCDWGQALMRDKACFAEYKRTGKVSEVCAQRARAAARKTGHCKQYAKGKRGGGSRPHGGGRSSGGDDSHSGNGGGTVKPQAGGGSHHRTCCIWSGCSQFHEPSCGGHNGSGCFSHGPVGTPCGGSYCFQYCNGG